jgi:hypothetical protein
MYGIISIMISVLALIVSCISIFIAYQANNEAKRTNNEAEKQAKALALNNIFMNINAARINMERLCYEISILFSTRV